LVQFGSIDKTCTYILNHPLTPVPKTWIKYVAMETDITYIKKISHLCMVQFGSGVSEEKI
jgi:hypothetical protein